VTSDTSFGLVRYQYPAASIRHVQRFEYAGFGSGYGLSLGELGMGGFYGHEYT
jgi:hypothetical protein